MMTDITQFFENRQPAEPMRFFAGDDGQTWASLMADVDVSGLQHDSFWGFLTLRLGLMAAGNGEVKFDHFAYKKL